MDERNERDEREECFDDVVLLWSSSRSFSCFFAEDTSSRDGAIPVAFESRIVPPPWSPSSPPSSTSPASSGLL